MVVFYLFLLFKKRNVHPYLILTLHELVWTFLNTWMLNGLWNLFFFMLCDLFAFLSFFSVLSDQVVPGRHCLATDIINIKAEAGFCACWMDCRIATSITAIFCKTLKRLDMEVLSSNLYVSQVSLSFCMFLFLWILIIFWHRAQVRWNVSLGFFFFGLCL